MSYLPIASLFARDATEQQFKAHPAPRSPGATRVEPHGPVLRTGVARGLRRLADRLEPGSIRSVGVPQATPAARRDSPC
jgi:hypothetical protein